MERLSLNGGRTVREAFEAFASQFPPDKLYDEEQRVSSLGQALAEAQSQLQKHGSLQVDYALVRPDHGYFCALPASAAPGLEWLVQLLVWAPWLQKFREGHWVAKGRPHSFAHEPSRIPAALFNSKVEFNLLQSSIEDLKSGTRYVDVVIYSREYLEDNEAEASTETESVIKRGRRRKDDYLSSGAMDRLIRYLNEAKVYCTESEAAEKLCEFHIAGIKGRPRTLSERKDRNAVDRALYFLKTNFRLLLQDCCRIA